MLLQGQMSDGVERVAGYREKKALEWEKRIIKKRRKGRVIKFSTRSFNVKRRQTEASSYMS